MARAGGEPGACASGPDALDRQLAPFVDDEGVVVPVQTWLAAATRPATG